MTRHYYADVPIPSGFTLEKLAERYLGSSTRWPDLVVLNNLRYPYLSEDPAERAGPLLTTALIRANPHTLGGDITSQPLITGVAAGEMVVPITTDVSVIRGQRALFLNLVEGLPQWHLATILGAVHHDPDGPLVDASVQAAYPLAVRATWPAPPLLILAEPLVYSFTQGGRVSIHPDPAQTLLRVTGPGDTLRVPITRPGAALLPLDLDATDILGTDIRISDRGMLTIGDNGDLATATGRANVRQALWLRLATPFGDLPLHGGYGNQLHQELGSAKGELWVLAHAYVRQAVAGDPRIGGIVGSQVTITGDAMNVDVSAQIAGFDQLVAVSTIFRTGAPANA